MLETPLGKLSVYKNGKQIEYWLNLLPLKPIEICNYEVDARYLIEVDKSQISPGDILTFTIDTDILANKDGGDCLVESMFESDELFLAMGGYNINIRDCSYTFSTLENGLQAEIIDLQYIEDFSVAIAWSNTNNEDYYTSVWFAADPYI